MLSTASATCAIPIVLFEESIQKLLYFTRKFKIFFEKAPEPTESVTLFEEFEESSLGEFSPALAR